MAESSPKQIAPYGLRIPADLKGRIQASAEHNSRSLHGEILHALEGAYPPHPSVSEMMRQLEDLRNAMVHLQIEPSPEIREAARHLSENLRELDEQLARVEPSPDDD